MDLNLKAQHKSILKVFKTDAVDEKLVEESKGELKKILYGYDKKKIFTTGETNLFYNVLPNKTFKYKNEKFFGRKYSKELLTVLLCSKSDASEKFPLLVIDKPKQPMCFNNIKENLANVKTTTNHV